MASNKQRIEEMVKSEPNLVTEYADYKLLIDLLDHGWKIKEFNSRTITLKPDWK